MDTDQLLQYLRDHALEEGRAYIQEHLEALSDHKATGDLLAEEALRILYTPFLSLKIAELLISYGEITGDIYSRALGLKAKGDVLFQIGHHEVALQVLDAAGEMFLYLGDKGNWARSRISWVLSAGWIGRVQEALEAAKQARNTFLKLGEQYWVGVIDNNTAMVYEFVGQYQDARELYENMLAIFPSVSDQNEDAINRSIAIAQVNQARNVSWLGDLEKAQALLLQARQIFISLNEMALVNSVEIDLADLDYAQGYYGSALRRYYQVREGMIEHGVDNPVLLAELKLCMSNCLMKLNRTQEASLLSEEAIKTYRELGTSLSTGNALREYGRTLVASGRLQEAALVLDEASKLFHDGGFHPQSIVTRLQQAEICLATRDVTQARALATLARDYCTGQGLVAQAIRANLVIIESFVESRQQTGANQEKEHYDVILQEALSLCKQTVLQARRHNLQEELYNSHHLLGRMYALQEDFAKTATHFGAAIAQIEHILDDLVFDLSPSFLHKAWAVYADMIALCLQQSKAELAFAYLEQARSMALRRHLQRSKEKQETFVSVSTLRTQYELRDWQDKHRFYSVLLSEAEVTISPTIDKEIIRGEIVRCEGKLNELLERLYLSEYETPVENHPFSSKKRSIPIKTDSKALRIVPGQVRQRLTSDHLLLEYYLDKGKLVIFAITCEQVMTYEHPGGEAELEYLLPLLHAHLQPGGWSDPAQPPQRIVRRLLHKLFHLLIAPIEGLLPASSGTLTIVPYGPLHKLPFHALYDGSRFLIEEYQVNYLPASNLLLHLRSDWNTADVTPFNAAPGNVPLVFGYSGKGQLGRVQDEARSIAEMLHGQCYLEEEATIARLIEKAPGSPLIHLATHGQSRLDAPNFSYVRLADGQFNAIDAFSLDLQHCELVTLSGCETGLALSSGGDEQLGLGRAFLAAGTKSLVISLWPVEDRATNELMKCFYLHLLQGENKMQALRAAQCSLLRQSGKATSHPYFWAAFRLVGEGGSLHWRSF